MDQCAIIDMLADNLSLQAFQVNAVIALMDEGCTIPFIARYRKERTGNLDEVLINAIAEKFKRTKEQEERREYILNYLLQNEKLTPELDAQIRKAATLQEIEDLYAPYKPRKKTLADKARELGLAPLAEMIIKKKLSEKQALEEAEKYITVDVPDKKTALDHAVNIMIQLVSDFADVRKYIRDDLKHGRVTCTVKRGKQDEGKKYKDYFEFSEKATTVPSHRIMALVRGSHEGVLNIGIEPDTDRDNLDNEVSKIAFQQTSELCIHASSESLKRHLIPSLGNEIINDLWEHAEKESVYIFSRNLEKILLSAPFGERAVIGIDPGIRTGCKAAVIDKSGVYKEFMTIYLNRDMTEVKKLATWIEKYNVEGIAVGSGTYGRETYRAVSEFCKDSSVVVSLVDEDGASVYSAGDSAREEFPALDLTVKGAISIARRFQDPLAELVKIDPKALGIGQYQHDITPALLKEKLAQTVEWGVNKVGVNINTAGYHLLSYVSGLDFGKAKEIVKYRGEHKRISSREELKKIKGIGGKIFEQCAGFLRIIGGDAILDSTGVHPESYTDVARIADFYKVTLNELTRNPDIIKDNEIKENLKVSELRSIIDELKLKGLDPRKEFSAVEFSDEIRTLDDLQPGMILNGMVDNVVAFGLFVDIGLKEKGLVHISEISNDYIKDINTACAVGDRVQVKVLSLDKDRNRIALSMKQPF